MSKAEPKGIIGKTEENGMPVIWSFVNELPAREDRELLPWLIVMAWQYDGSERNGMPSEEINKKMLMLEEALEPLEQTGKHVLVYCRTGNGFKEFAYYAYNTEAFMDSLNCALASHDRYPIETRFYEDREWSDFCKLLENFGYAQQSVQPDRREDAAPG